ncbi:MAG: glycosyltransferase [Clostridia bacterium]|nr:glycosyltransferase [Clostridia bacterium]
MKKKIIFISQALWIGGIESALVNLLNALDYERYDITCLILQDYQDMAHRIPESCKLLVADRGHTVTFTEKYKWSRLFNLMEKPKNAPYFRLLIWKVLCLLLKAPEAILYSRYIKRQLGSMAYDTAVIYSDVAAEIAVRAVTADRFLMFYHHGAMRRVYHDIFGYKKSEAVITVSHSQAESLREFVPQYADKVQAIPNLIDVDNILNRSQEEPTIIFPEDGFHIVTCGRLSREKGMDLAVEACSILVNKGYTDLHWWLIGGGPMTDELQRLTKEFRMENHVHFLGMQPNPYPFILQGDLAVQPSRFEGHCVAIMEYKILGRPIVSTKAAAKEQITDGVNGILCDTNAVALADAIERFIDDETLLKKLKENSPEEEFKKQNALAVKQIEMLL